MAKVRKFDTGVSKPASQPSGNRLPDIPKEAVESLSASAPLQTKRKPGNPRPRRYRQKTYSLTDADIERLERLVADVRKAGLYERSRSDIVRAGLMLIERLSTDQRVAAVEGVENLKG